MGFENIGLSIFFYPFIDLNVGPTLVIRSPIYYGVEAAPCCRSSYIKCYNR